MRGEEAGGPGWLYVDGESRGGRRSFAGIRVTGTRTTKTEPFKELPASFRAWRERRLVEVDFADGK
jgi:hypothetical protein